MQTIFIETEAEKRGELAPVRLGEKLKRIRTDHELTQGKMLMIVNPTEFCETNRARISQYENGTRVPSPIELYNYARFAGITMETLIDDNLDLPATTRCNSDEQKMKESVGGEVEKIQTINGLVGGKSTSSLSQSSEDNEKSKGENIFIGDGGIYRGELLNLPLIIQSDLVEATSYQLPSETLDELHDMHLELLRRIPRALRRFLTVEGIVNFCIKVLVVNYKTHGEKSLIYGRTQLIDENSKQAPENLKIEGSSFAA